MRPSRKMVASYAALHFLFVAITCSNSALAAAVNFTSVVDPDPDIVGLSPNYTFEHNLISLGFNPATDTLTSAEILLYFNEVGPINFTDDSVTIYLDDALPAVESQDPPSLGPWDGIFSVDVSLLQTDGILAVVLEGGGNSIFERSELTAQGTSVVPVPAAAWLFGSALLGLGALKRRKF